MGNMTTHIVPIVGGEVQMKDIKRINVGGYHSFDLLYKHLNLKYPAFKSKLSQNYVQAIMENLTFVANDYRDQLNYFRYGREYFQNQNYSNKILYENNKIINMTLHQEVFEPVYLEFPFNFEPVKIIIIKKNNELANFNRGLKEKTRIKKRTSTKIERNNG
jgi:Actin and related proteins